MIPRTDERPSTIALQVSGKYEEGRADTDTTIYPGMALELTTDEPNQAQLPPGVKPNSSAGFSGPVRIAKEILLGNPNPTQRFGSTLGTAYKGELSSSGDDNVFDNGDLVPYFIPAPGDIYLARVAASSSWTFGSRLQLHSDGTFVALSSGAAVAQVMETIDFGDDAYSDALPLLRVQAL